MKSNFEYRKNDGIRERKRTYRKKRIKVKQEYKRPKENEVFRIYAKNGRAEEHVTERRATIAMKLIWNIMNKPRVRRKIR